MGCGGSKPLDSPAVDLCRKRCNFLDEAIHQRYALAEAHLAYFHSLKFVGDSLHRFFDIHSAAVVGTDSPSSPVLNLPAQRKEDPSKPPAPSVKTAPVVAHRHSHSNSGSSHLHFHTDSEDDSADEDESLHLHSENGGSSPLHHHRYNSWSYTDPHESLGSSYLPSVYPDPPAGYPPAGYPSGGYTMNYMRKEPTPSVLYQQRPVSSEPIRFGEASSSSYYSSNYNPNPNSYSYNNNYSNYGEFFGSSSQTPPYGGVSLPPAEASSSNSKPPPPPPLPPSSTWDFLNPFETSASYYPPYTSSRDSRDVRDEEGIPDLEDVDFYQHAVVKKVQGNQKFVDGGGGAGDVKKAAVVNDESEERAASDLHYRSAPNVVAKEDDPVEFEVHVVDKEVVDDQKKPVVFQNDSEVVKEIQKQFDLASELGSELAKTLEVGKLPHNRKHVAYQVPSKMLNVFTASLAVAPPDPAMDTDVDLLTKSKSLSSTLHKLYLWEKKLFDEVKIEEKMRLLHEEKKRKLVRMDEKGAEPHKIDATRTVVASLSSKIRIAIQVVDKISDKINSLRDEELWPQLNDFIQGITRMWKSMHECHRSQCQAIGAAKRIDATASNTHLKDEDLEATLQLEHELLNWAIRFSFWFGAQKGFVKSLNEWLLKCLMYEPEDTVDGPVPYSPGRIGAPAIFVVCNQWAQSMQRVSDKEVVDSMRDIAATVLELWERDKVEMRQRMVVHKNMERSVKDLDKEDQRIQKEIQMLDKMMVVAGGDENAVYGGRAVYQSETSKKGSLQTSMQRVFESLERFTAASLKGYEELLVRIEEEKLGQ